MPEPTNERPRLHTKVSSAEPTGKGALAASQPHRATGQGRRAVWEGVSSALASLESSRGARLAFPPPPPQPVVELERNAAVWSLHRTLRAEAGKIVEKELPPLALERWLLAGLPRANSGASGSDDPLLHTNAAEKIAAPMLVEAVERAGGDHPGAVRVAAAVARAAEAGQARVKSAEKKAKKSTQRVMVSQSTHSLDVTLDGGGRLFKVNNEHYEKLRDLWALMHGASKVVVSEVVAARSAARESLRGLSSKERRIHAREFAAANIMPLKESEEEAFNAALFSVLVRYQALQGAGFQSACSEHVQQALASTLGVTHECFASPLNSYFASFCSAFPDTDAAFGSLGSFWAWSPPPCGGSFEVNPPFVSDILLDTAQRIESLLGENEDTSPLSFAIIVPGWPEDSGIKTFEASTFLQTRFVVAIADHGFCDGAQHQRQDRYRASPYDTFVYILQNKKGKAAWPLDESVIVALRDAFAMAKPSAAAVLRRKKAGRGRADGDGGGGVYKGKPKNRRGRKRRPSSSIESESS